MAAEYKSTVSICAHCTHSIAMLYVCVDRVGGVLFLSKPAGRRRAARRTAAESSTAARAPGYVLTCIVMTFSTSWLPSSWRMEFTDVELILIMGALIAAIILLVALLMLSYRVMLLRAGGGSDTGPAHAAEYDTLQVVIEAHGQEAELEVATEGFDTYEEVSAPP